MGNVLEEVKAARDAVLARNLIVQMGAQHRGYGSSPQFFLLDPFIEFVRPG